MINAVKCVHEPCNSCHIAAQIASWVAQASFKPLGLTIAVAKDRAIESLMQARPQRLRLFTLFENALLARPRVT